jgi:hypothetical protein
MAWPDALWRHADAHDCAERPHDDRAALRTPSRHARRGSRDSVVSRAAGRRRCRPVLRQSRREQSASWRESRVGDVEHRAGRVTIRNQTLFGDYDRFYQNFVPGRRHRGQATGLAVGLQQPDARRNLFNQTDATYVAATGSVRHTLLAGAEVGRQLTDNFRNTGFFNNTATALLVPFAARPSPRR